MDVLTDVIIVNALAGMVGGGLYGLLGWLDAQKAGEELDLLKFAKSLVPALVAGFATGLISTDWQTSFLAGLGGSAVMNKTVKLMG